MYLCNRLPNSIALPLVVLLHLSRMLQDLVALVVAALVEFLRVEVQLLVIDQTFLGKVRGRDQVVEDGFEAGKECG